MNESATSFAPLSSLEISGAITGRVIHDLTNHLSGIMGNAEYAQRADADPENLRKALLAISVAANSAGKILGQCLPLQQAVMREFFPYPTTELTVDIAEAAGLAPGWHVNPPPELNGNVSVQPRWLIAAIWQLAREADARSGEIDFVSGPAVFPVVWSGSNSSRPSQLFQIILRYRADLPLVPNGSSVTAERPALLAAHEIVRRCKGQIHYTPKPPGRQEITVLLPLV